MPSRSSGGPVVTVTRGARERSLYEFTPTGRREVQVTGKEDGPRDQPIALETGGSQDHRETQVIEGPLRRWEKRR